MTTLTFLTSFLLILIGIGGKVISDTSSMTALIPAFLGILIFLCGLVALKKPTWKKHVMHVAVLLSVIGIGGSSMGIPKLIKHLSGETIERPLAAWSQSLTALILLIFLILAIRSFVLARIKR